MFLTFFNTGIRILCYERGNKFFIGNRLLLHTVGIWFVVVMLPAIFFGYLFYFIADHFEAGSLLARILGNLERVVLYFAGVYATYRHVRWREKNIPHLLKTKGNED